MSLMVGVVTLVTIMEEVTAVTSEVKLVTRSIELLEANVTIETVVTEVAVVRGVVVLEVE